MWQAESDDVRAHFKAQAEAEKLEHLKENPGYQYKPRKASEKKRRMSKKKLLMAMAGPKNAAAYLDNVKETGHLRGNPSEIRRGSLPLSAQAKVRVGIDNEKIMAMATRKRASMNLASRFLVPEY